MKDRLCNDLARIHNLITNCDNKLSIMLGSTLTVVTLVLSFFKDELYRSMSNPVVDVLSILALIVLIAGLYNILKGLIGRIHYRNDSVPDSIIYFGKIAEKSYANYSVLVDNFSEADYIGDLKAQIYVNSCICKMKFNYYNRGLILCAMGWILLLLLVLACYFNL